ncbi:protein ENHANCED DOWNY MILDEW 2-like [Oryza brachyantha]|uniref:Zinc finger PHD-type domain-containing protein n=1 Tax=Oryza brachyantha TaxID=4533 RepID=J3L0E2_ORYBR|nr:protein ENHANCED DOWNY MILDEW 2-like [Oryza brachyantha]
MMFDDDDDDEPQLNAVENYYLLDAREVPICLSALPFQFKATDGVPECKRDAFLWGTTDPGIKVYKKVVAWRLGLQGKQPEISVLSAEGSWISLRKPKNSYEEEIRTIMITVQMLHFLKRKPEETEKNMWSHLRKVFDKFEVRPSEDDIRNHRSLIKQFAEKDVTLAKSEILQGFTQENCRKKSSEVGLDKVESKVPFIADDEDIEMVDVDNNIESDEEEEEDLFDSICSICDDGGDLLCCDGPCMRSFHAKIGTGEDSYCDTLGYTEAEVQAMKTFLCKNCEHKQHQCFTCGALESSDGPTAKVFLCNNATCGRFYHPKCVARQLHSKNKNEASELEMKIADGLSFTCPIHWCFRCKGLEDRTQEELQFAVCRRCPKSYHRKCLPREIAFEDSENEDIVTRAWELSKRILIYCLDHEIDTDIDTPTRDHIKFPRVSNIGKPASLLKKSIKEVVKKKKRPFCESVPDQLLTEPGKSPDMVCVQEIGEARTISSRSSSEQFVVKPEEKKTKFLKDRSRPKPCMIKDAATSSTKPAKDHEKQLVTMPSSTSWKVPQSSFPTVDSETEKRVIALVEREAPCLTLQDVSRKCMIPSTHAYSGRQVDRIIATGKLERSVQAVGSALKLLENGGSVNDAKAVCEPEVLKQLTRWHSKLRVYISPFIYGTRYSSFGRHFTKVEKLVEIVGKLHCYVEPGDTIVDFCCGANDFSRLMKEKLDQVHKNCHFKNYDLIQPQNCFSFERKDWMTVQPNELPHGSKLIMGLNPPFGVKAALANKFIDKALSFKPKLIILIVPKETKRLDQKKTPYDLIWEDSDCLSGKAFYLPGSVDVNDKIVEGWNASTPPLYLWSRPDWTKKHMKVAEVHKHVDMERIASRVEEDNLSDSLPMMKETESSGIHNSRSGNEGTGKTSCYLKEMNLSDLPVRRQAEAGNNRNAGPGKEKVTTERTSCDVREVILSGDHVKRQAGCGEVKAKEYHTPDSLPVKKQAKINYQQISQPGKDIKNTKRTPDQVYCSLPPEKQVEVAYEERMVIPIKKSTHQEKQLDANCGNRINARAGSEIMVAKFTERENSDMSISSPDSSNARKSRSGSAFISSGHPADKTAHRNSFMSCPTKEQLVCKKATYQGSYLESNNECSDAFAWNVDPPFNTNIDDISRKFSTDVGCEVNRQRFTSSTGDEYSLQSLRHGDSFYWPKHSEEWNTNAVESSIADVPLQEHLTRYSRQFGDNYQEASRVDRTLDEQEHIRTYDGHADDYLSQYSLGSSGGRYGQPLTSSYGIPGTSTQYSIMDKHAPGFLAPSVQRGSVMDRYALGPGAPGSSVMDKYVPPLEDTNYTTPGVPQYPYRQLGSFGGGWPRN